MYAPVNKIVYRVRDAWLAGSRQATVRRIAGTAYQIIHEVSPYTGWKTVGVFSLKEILRQVNDIRFLSVVVGILTLLFAFAVSLYFAASISHPVVQLKELMRRVEGGDLAIRFTGRARDEIGQLGHSFNTMVDN